MTAQHEERLNDFFVHIFNKILAWEEQALSRVGSRDLSVKELHVLEAVAELTARDSNTMTSVAEQLSVRVSTLTTAVNTLVRKGYLVREGLPGDRRVIRVLLTEKGEEANRLHSQFHTHMIQSAASQLTEMELEVLLLSLSKLDQFFTGTLQDEHQAITERNP